ncbi:S-layer homology domain-containing protein [Ureibacillus suwonensis]|uniref:S-layer homology domain-containing protein n=1 Tax=Ureibacillus suwonensis TaxID=313007 RepID=A0ABW0RCX9_9BACL
MTILKKCWIFVIGIITASILVAAPANAATNPFIDVTTKDTHYPAIVELYNKGIVEGTSSKTYEPYKQVTRQEAALFIANALKLDTVNVPNAKFTDVPKSSKYYGAIAALSYKGVISGYPDGTFRPTNTLTRSQIAKMITLAFELSISKNTVTPFKDVNSISDIPTRQYIQTLVDYKITTGTTPTTFSPYTALTRGQLATFLKRAIDATGGGDFEIIGIE